MKKWMIPVFAVGGVATVGAAVLGGMLLFGGDKGGMETPEDVMEIVVQTYLDEGDFEQIVKLGRYPMIKAVCDPEATDRQVMQCVDKASEYWDEGVQSIQDYSGGIKSYTVASIEQLPLDEDVIAKTVEGYGNVGEQVDDVVDVNCEINIINDTDEESNLNMGVRAIEIDDRWYIDFLESGMAASMKNAYHELYG